MSELIDIIKNIAQKSAENYIISKENMNDNIILTLNNIDFNDEIIRRICELSNQNVYLALFNNPSINKGDIQFDLADSNYIINQLKESEKAMEDYQLIPKNFRSGLEISDDPTDRISNELDTTNIKLATLDEAVYNKNKYQLLLDSIETMKVAEKNNAIESFNEIFHNSKIMTANGESIADMAKIAMRVAQEDGFDMMKIAKVYDMISEELKNSGFRVNHEITKTSSLAINHESDTLKPVKNYMFSISKIAAYEEMKDGIQKSLDSYKKVIKAAA